MFSSEYLDGPGFLPVLSGPATDNSWFRGEISIESNSVSMSLPGFDADEVGPRSRPDAEMRPSLDAESDAM